MRCALSVLLFIVLSGPVLAQSTGNDWIRPGQSYWKIPVAQTGLYRISYADLTRAGIPVSKLDKSTLQLFHRGIGQAVFVSGPANEPFTPTDYIDFYGQRNDGTLDSLLYKPASAQPHPYYNLFSDTTAYFLTIGPNAGRRMTVVTDTAAASLTPVPFVWADELRLFTDMYPGYAAGLPNKVESSYFEAGEGYTGPILQKNQFADQSFVLNNPYRAGPAPGLDVLLVGREYANHLVETYTGPTQTTRQPIDTVGFLPYDNARVRKSLRWNDIAADGRLLVGTRAINPDVSTDRYSVSFMRLRYPQRPTVNYQLPKTFGLTASATSSFLILNQLPANARLFDITDPNAPVRYNARVLGDSLRVVLPKSPNGRTLLCVGEPLAISALHPITFRSFVGNQADYVIITHEQLMQPIAGQRNAVRAYADYRASAAGGGHDTLVVTVSELFDQYSYGERSPLAIRRFCDELLRTGQPKFLLLLGRSRHPAAIRTNPSGPLLDLVPTGGYPGSDALFTVGLDGFPADVPALPTGRINAATPQEIRAYLDKVKEFEALPPDADWRKNVLHLSGGRSASELFLFKSLVDSYGRRAETGSLGAAVTRVTKKTDVPTEAIDLSGPVNAGVGLLTFFGHSSLATTDLDFGLVSDDTRNYRNRGRYPLLFVNGCALGNFFFGAQTTSVDWLLTPNRGAIAVLAHSHLGTLDALDRYATQFYSVLGDSLLLSQPIGVIQQETIRRVLSQQSSPADIANAHQLVLQGDPALRIFPFSQPDYALPANGLTVSKRADSVQLRIVMVNYGQFRSGTLPIRIQRNTGGRANETFVLTTKATVFRDTITVSLPRTVGLAEFVVTLNPNDLATNPALPETNRTNNEIRLTVDLTTEQPTPLPPDRTGPLIEAAFDGVRIADGVVVSPTPLLDVLVVDDNRVRLRQDTTNLDLYLKMGETGVFRRVNWRGASYQPADSQNVFRLRYPMAALPDGLHQLRLTARDADNNPAAPYNISLRVVRQPQLIGFGAYPNPFSDQTTFAFDLTGIQPPGSISLTISNLSGQMVRRLVNPTRIGRNEWAWDGRSDAGGLLPVGIYLYDLQTGDFPVNTAVQLRGRVVLTR